jgi:hypothetical protein
VQAGSGARPPGSGLDEITDLVDQPQAVAVQQLIRREPVPGERIGDPAAVGDLTDDLFWGLPDLYRSAADRVAHGVSGEFADGEDLGR